MQPTNQRDSISMNDLNWGKNRKRMEYNFLFKM